MQRLTGLCLALYIVGVFTVEKVCDKAKCIGDQKLYKELGCKPVFKDNECCPERYDCPDFKSYDKNKCYLNGNTYEPRDKVNDTLTVPLCAASCFCSNDFGHNDPALFNCAQIECPELFNPPEPGCIHQIEKGNCCSGKKFCGDEKANLSKCYLDGHEYYEGQKMYPEHESCYTCICAKGFENTTMVGNPHCDEIDCGTELRYMHRLQTECVPMYFKDSKCCPIGWRCPTESDERIPNAKSTNESEHFCMFGKLKLNIGDELKTEENDETCTCVTPPFLQCIRS